MVCQNQLKRRVPQNYRRNFDGSIQLLAVKHTGYYIINPYDVLCRGRAFFFKTHAK